ncbi:MAG TPA: serine hydrolase, partial [Chthonomonadaceae bacterium]|nr:serine hydrolase [Chthonomonadaceae bacterium]
MQQEIEALIQQSGADRVAVAYEDLETGHSLFLRADEPFHPASTFKVCVLMELYRQSDTGALALDDTLAVYNTFPSIVDGSPFSTYVEDDSETSLYARIGERVSLRELGRLMVTQSSNLATNILVERLGAAQITAFMRDLGAEGLLVLRGVEDNKAFALGKNNVATARGLLCAWKRLAQAEVVSKEASEEMLAVLRQQQHVNGIPAGLPAGVPVANKPGWNTLLFHDAAAVFPPRRAPFLLVVMTQGLA